MKPKNLPDNLRNVIQKTVWEHWTKLGVRGNIEVDEMLNVDPEALLLHSSSLFKNDLRLCFEVARWLIRFEDLFYPKRLKRMIDRIQTDDSDPLLYDKIRILGFVIETIVNHGATTYRWQSVQTKLEDEKRSFDSSIVLGSDKNPENRYDWDDRWGIIAPRILKETEPYENLKEWNRKKWVRTNLRFWLRSFFGTNPRSEIINFLGCGQPTSGNNLAREVYLSQSSVNMKLRYLTEIDVLSAEKVGAANIYSLNKRDVLPDQFSERTFFNWECFYRAVHVAGGVFEKATRATSDYQREKLVLKIKNGYQEILFQSTYNRENVQSVSGYARSVHEVFDSEDTLMQFVENAVQAD